MLKKIALLTGCLLILSIFSFSKTTFLKENNGWKLYVDGKPFVIKGVTFGRDIKRETIGVYMKQLKSMGVNTVRTWGCGEETQILLDSADAYGIKVLLGIWMRHGRPGMEGDDSFNYLADKKGMEDMYNGAINAVKKYKDHPAVLFFGMGNEVFLNIATDKEKKAYSQFLETVCKKVKEIDPNHPITAVDAWTFGFEWWSKYCPSIDIYGVNCYGAGANQIPGELEKQKIDKPYMITEYGVRGEWEVKPDKNGLKVEPNDAEKYTTISKGVHDWIYSKPGCLGVYVFNYGNGADHGAVWLSMMFDNQYRPAYWATREAYTGEKPINNLPSINTYELPDAVVKPGDWVKVKLDVTDAENDPLDISFQYCQRSGGRVRADQINSLEMRGNLKDGYEFQVPDENGVVKLYVFVKDSYKNISIAQTSLMINKPGADPKFTPGARTKLPFYVFYDNEKAPYVATAYMGDMASMKVDTKNHEFVNEGFDAIKIAYNKTDGWWGLGFVDPADDWGKRPGGFSVVGATKYTFWAKANVDKVEVTVGFGLIGNDQPYYDSAKESIKVEISKKWKKYEIPLTDKMDLRCIRSGLVLYGGGIGQNYAIWLDDVQFEK